MKPGINNYSEIGKLNKVYFIGLEMKSKGWYLIILKDYYSMTFLI